MKRASEIMSVRHILRSLAMLVGMAMLFVSLSTPATAHKKHVNKEQEAPALVQNGSKPALPTGNEAVAEDADTVHAGAAVEHGHGRSPVQDLAFGHGNGHGMIAALG